MGDFEALYAAINPGAPVQKKILEELDASGLNYVVIGGHARNAWLDPADARTTSDLDVIVETADLARVVAAARPLILPPVEVAERPGFASLRRRPGKGGKRMVKVFDVGTPSLHPLYEVALAARARKHVPGLQAEGWIVVPEALIALKILSALSATRKPKKQSQDVTDVLYLLDDVAIDPAAAHRFLTLVPGGPEKLAEIRRQGG